MTFAQTLDDEGHSGRAGDVAESALRGLGSSLRQAKVVGAGAVWLIAPKCSEPEALLEDGREVGGRGWLELIGRPHRGLVEAADLA